MQSSLYDLILWTLELTSIILLEWHESLACLIQTLDTSAIPLSWLTN